ncbi:MAG: hypothetical protein ACOH13_15710 [Flavobacteriales bacterium]
MNKRFSLLTATFFLFGAANAQARPLVSDGTTTGLAISPNSGANIAVVNTYLQGLVKRDAAAVRAVVNPGFLSYATWSPGDTSVVDSVIQRWVRIGANRTDQELETTTAFSVTVAPDQQFAGDWVYYWATYTANDTRSGRKLEVPIFTTVYLTDGKLTAEWTYYDRLAIWNQLGIAPPAPKTAGVR